MLEKGNRVGGAKQGGLARIVVRLLRLILPRDKILRLRSGTDNRDSLSASVRGMRGVFR